MGNNIYFTTMKIVKNFQGMGKCLYIYIYIDNRSVKKKNINLGVRGKIRIMGLERGAFQFPKDRLLSPGNSRFYFFPLLSKIMIS